MRKGLLISTMLVSVAGLGMSADVWAQCATTTCSSLGYTSSLNTGDCLKCPFGEAWACSKITCPDYAKYTCSGTGYAGGRGTACGGKYAECACASGYEWKNGGCFLRACQIGDILYSDKTCSSDVVPDKTPIAVVAYIDGTGYGQALALNSIGSYKWSTEYTDVPTLTNYKSGEEFDVDSCGNTEKIIAYGDKNKYPAAWAAHEYSTEGTSAGDWCLPADGIFSSVYDNLFLMTISLTNAGGTQLAYSSNPWSSTERNKTYAYYLYITSSSAYTSKDYSYEVRPVIEFTSGSSGTSCLYYGTIYKENISYTGKVLPNYTDGGYYFLPYFKQECRLPDGTSVPVDDSYYYEQYSDYSSALNEQRRKEQAYADAEKEGTITSHDTKAPCSFYAPCQ